MIPIENSVAGRVADIHHLMPTSGLHIVAEYFLPVSHHLMAPRGATLKTIKTVQSHIHALGQCRRSIRKLRLKTVIGADTAGSARQIAEGGDKTRAAVAPALAAKIYKLKILRRNIEDERYNTTRFIVLSRKARRVPRKTRTWHDLVFEVRNSRALYKRSADSHQRHQHDQLEVQGQCSSRDAFYAEWKAIRPIADLNGVGRAKFGPAER